VLCVDVYSYSLTLRTIREIDIALDKHLPVRGAILKRTFGANIVLSNDSRTLPRRTNMLTSRIPALRQR
jgi:hypothetical protein